MADIRTCRNCKRLFTDYIGRHLCDHCLKEDDELFDRVKEYVREHQDATIFSTSEACEVSEEKIRRWLKEERLTYRNNDGSGLYCEKCGAPISSGRYCHFCKMALSRAFGAIMQENEAPKMQNKVITERGSRMRFLNKV